MSAFVLQSKDGWLRLNTWKEGLLSRMGHDLLLAIREFSISVEYDDDKDWHVSVKIDKDSFFVKEPDSLSAKDKAEIHQNICNQLPDDILFEGSVVRKEEEAEVQGFLSLGRTSIPIRFAMSLHEGVASGRVELSHRALNIKPYRAPLGLIRLQDRLELSFSFDLRSWLDVQET